MPVELSIQPGRWRSVPTVVEAMQYTPETRLAVRQWLNLAGAVWWTDATGQLLRIMTPQGSRQVDWTDWVIHGVIGEWYPIQDRVFQLRYRATEDDLLPIGGTSRT